MAGVTAPLPGSPTTVPGPSALAAPAPTAGAPVPAPGAPAPAPAAGASALVAPAPGAPAPGPSALAAAAPASAPAPGAPAPAPGAPTPAPAPGAGAPGAPTPVPASAPGVPAPAPGALTPVPGAPAPAPVPGIPTPAPAPDAPAPVPGIPTPAPAPDAPAPAPVPGTPTPAPAPDAPAPVPGTPTPAPAPVPGAPAPTPSTLAPAAPTLASPIPAAAVPVTVSGQLGGEQGGEGPWGRYDPWGAASAEEQVFGRKPLQQTGARVLTDRQRRRRGNRLLLVWTLLVAVVSAGIGGAVGAYVERAGLGDDVRLPQAGSVPAGRAPDSVAGIAARALPSVVTLHVTGADEAGTGTGFVLDGQGHILTNNHVVEPAGSDGRISVTFSSGDTVKAKVVGRDSGYDLAVVQVHGVHGLTPLPLGNSDGVEVGDPVVAIGAPFDLANTVTSGIISAKERPITAGGEKGDGSDVSYVDALQTDAPINPGNSGGPLLDSRAHVIGINSAIRSAGSGSASESGQAGSIGLGFAIPVNQAKRVAEELINNGHATHPVIGVTLDMGYTGDGARIDSKNAGGGPAVTRGGPGERAGLKAGDVVTEVDGERVHTGEELIVKIRAHRPGDRLRLTVERGGTEREVSLVLGASEQN
ncbi:S1C family serine protease [Streptomyces sp. NPDC048521]|uniref:S1C family serine protease n=1 Tax=Streptomyces sp. NPDC048521 TaxID=3365566 RepID=UPI00371F2E31